MGGNVFISADHKHVKIGDLGLAQMAHRHKAATKELTWAGTPGYVAPEVWEHDAYSTGYSTRADNWSLGCIMMDIAYPTEWGGWSISFVLEESESDLSLDFYRKKHQD